MNVRVAVRAIILKDGKLLCARLNKYNELTRSYGNDWWCLPGGKVEDKEALVDAMRREMVEETGVEPVIGNLLYVHQFLFKDTNNLEFFFHITNVDDYLNIDLSNTTHGSAEIAEIKFVDPVSTTILPKFLSSEPLTEHAHSNGPAKFLSYLD